MSADSSAWISAAFAGASALLTGVTVWWPWHTRRQPQIGHEDAVMAMSDVGMGKLLTACKFRFPEVFVRFSNNGDGVAYRVGVETADERFDALTIVMGSKPDDFTIAGHVAVLNPGESFICVLLPNTSDPIESPVVKLDWMESPTRLKRGHARTKEELGCRLPAKRPLGFQERTVALGYIRQVAANSGMSEEKFVTDVLHLDYAEVDELQAPDLQDHIGETLL